MKIEKNKPLPEHTKIDYDECYAYLVLSDYFPDRYRNLGIKDKPDVSCLGVKRGKRWGIMIKKNLLKNYYQVVIY